jgi:hypothetical protein
VAQAKDSTGLNRPEPGNRTLDLQNDHAGKEGVQTLDLQKHRPHEEHEKYTDRTQIMHEKYTDRAKLVHVKYNRLRTKNTDRTYNFHMKRVYGTV